jgi:hypothetical protein
MSVKGYMSKEIRGSNCGDVEVGSRHFLEENHESPHLGEPVLRSRLEPSECTVRANSGTTKFRVQKKSSKELAPVF